MKLVQIYLDDETHTTLAKNYTIALAAVEESFTFEDYVVYLLQAVSTCLPTHAVQLPGKEKAKLKQKILSFRGKEYIVQNFIVDLECNECGRLFRCPGVYRSESTKTERARKLVDRKYRNGIVPIILTRLKLKHSRRILI
jgi:hypothetical protein